MYIDLLRRGFVVNISYTYKINIRKNIWGFFKVHFGNRINIFEKYQHYFQYFKKCTISFSFLVESKPTLFFFLVSFSIWHVNEILKLTQYCCVYFNFKVFVLISEKKKKKNYNLCILSSMESLSMTNMIQSSTAPPKPF